ncbi:MAG: hypothetical protein QF921_16845 [Pseudomonadales bacterium]|jgi:hypothetical protein|nr:hypothetical protein [Pseudomonadales bacterium]MDP6471117.1 hypothetical protein [Pseudomonadales bacterium]MDP6825697.1 hypothetical protein [Pseudomonadales bacterium]MDP6973153.1 hypothetical protein [Pseudomonadales bacterium]|tara:strand:- start:1985 stop:2266 length:282 start_codon:yes stop_codon:yes gene_type:complete
MNRTQILCALSDALMESFSAQTLSRLAQRKRFALLLPPLESFLEVNVHKEALKNRAVIEAAARPAGMRSPTSWASNSTARCFVWTFDTSAAKL